RPSRLRRESWERLWPMLALVRHADAGSRHDWDGDDAERPLTRRGRRQASRLVELLAPYPVSRIVSSRAARCVQTVEPLAAARRLSIEAVDELFEWHSP